MKTVIRYHSALSDPLRFYLCAFKCKVKSLEICHTVGDGHMILFPPSLMSVALHLEAHVHRKLLNRIPDFQKWSPVAFSGSSRASCWISRHIGFNFETFWGHSFIQSSPHCHRWCSSLIFGQLTLPWVRTAVPVTKTWDVKFPWQLHPYWLLGPLIYAYGDFFHYWFSTVINIFKKNAISNELSVDKESGFIRHVHGTARLQRGSGHSLSHWYTRKEHRIPSFKRID